MTSLEEANVLTGALSQALWKLREGRPLECREQAVAYRFDTAIAVLNIMFNDALAMKKGMEEANNIDMTATSPSIHATRHTISEGTKMISSKHTRTLFIVGELAQGKHLAIPNVGTVEMDEGMNINFTAIIDSDGVENTTALFKMDLCQLNQLLNEHNVVF